MKGKKDLSIRKGSLKDDNSRAEPNHMNNSYAANAAKHIDQSVSAVPRGLRIQSLSTNMTVRDNLNNATTDCYPDFKNSGSKMMAPQDPMFPGSQMGGRDLGNSNMNALHDSSCDMKSNSLHEYAQLAGYL